MKEFFSKKSLKRYSCIYVPSCQRVKNLPPHKAIAQ